MVMTLKEWCDDTNTKPSRFALLADVSLQACLNWLSGASVPSPSSMHRISVVTKGRVTPNDFYDLSEVERG